MPTQHEAYCRHLAYYLRFVEDIEPRLNGAEQATLLSQLEMEHANLQVVLNWALQSEPESGLRLCSGLWLFWEIRGYLALGRAYLTLALQREPAAAALVWRAKALHGAGMMAYRQGDYAVAQGFYRDSLALYEHLQDCPGIARVLNGTGLISWFLGDYATARSCFERSLEIDRASGNRVGIAVSLGNLGALACDQGDYATACMHLEESLAMDQEAECPRNTAMTLNGLGNALLGLADYVSARKSFEQSLAIKRRLGDKQGIAVSLHNLGLTRYALNEKAEARSLMVESLIIRREVGDKRGIIESVEGLAEIAMECGDAIKATRLFASVENQRERLHAPIAADELANYRECVNGLQATLGADLFAEMWARGRMMDFESMISYTLGEQPA